MARCAEKSACSISNVAFSLAIPANTSSAPARQSTVVARNGSLNRQEEANPEAKQLVATEDHRRRHLATSKFEEQLAKDKQQLADDKEQLAKGKEQLAKFKEQLAKDEEMLVNYKARVDVQMVEVCKEHEMLKKQLVLLNREKAEVGGESTGTQTGESRKETCLQH